MRVGMHLGYQNIHGVPDVESFMKETKLGIEAEAMGFDYVGPVEHHFTDYAACPDPFQCWPSSRPRPAPSTSSPPPSSCPGTIRCALSSRPSNSTFSPVAG